MLDLEMEKLSLNHNILQKINAQTWLRAKVSNKECMSEEKAIKILKTRDH